jgi:large subunit ribosomal protein L10
MDRTQKHAFVAGLNKGLGHADAMVVAHYRGLTVKQLQALRRAMKAAETTVQVSKNRLAKLAFKGTAFESLNDLMVGPTVLAYGNDALAATKIAQEFADKNDAMVILGGMMNGKKLSAADVKMLSKMPTMNEIRGKLVGLLQAPGGQIARVLKAHADQAAA